MSAHTHDLVPASPQVRRHARRVFAAILLPALLATLVGAWVLWPTGERPVLETSPPGMTFPTVTVVDVFPAATDPLRQVRATMADGSSAWVQVPPEYLPEIHPGDRVVAADLGSMGTPESGLVFTDFVRGPPLGLLAAVFAVLVVAVARWRGFAALVGLGISMGVIGVFMLPALLEGKPALPVALVTSSAIMFVVLYLAHGFTLRTSTALVGTLLGLLATGLLATWASGAAHLTGLSGEYALDLLSYAPQARMSAILLCGMVIAGLGVLNDVTITQASAVWELHGSSPEAGWRELFGRGMRIGRDHIASTIYTIAFAYAGASLPVLLLLQIYELPLGQTLTSGQFAQEIVRTLAGAIGLILAIPFTTAIAAGVALSQAPAELRRASAHSHVH